MFNIEQYLPEIEKICKKHDVKRLTLFGSALTSEFDPQNSDFDFLLELNKNKNGFHKYFEIKWELEKLLCREVDLVMPGAIKNQLLKKYIYQNTRQCYAA
jgi:hypothetical protein